MSKNITVFTIVTEDYGYTAKLSEVYSELESMEFGDSLTVTKREMTLKEFEALPEL